MLNSLVHCPIVRGVRRRSAVLSLRDRLGSRLLVVEPERSTRRVEGALRLGCEVRASTLVSIGLSQVRIAELTSSASSGSVMRPGGSSMGRLVITPGSLCRRSHGVGSLGRRSASGQTSEGVTRSLASRVRSSHRSIRVSRRSGGLSTGHGAFLRCWRSNPLRRRSTRLGRGRMLAQSGCLCGQSNALGSTGPRARVGCRSPVMHRSALVVATLLCDRRSSLRELCLSRCSLDRRASIRLLTRTPLTRVNP
jgi:hypothetical protein